MKSRSKVLRHREYRWEGVTVQEYKQVGDSFRGVTRQTILGEGEGEGDLAFLTRYFQVEPGGHSSREHHEHPHTVVVLRGEGEVVLGDETHTIAPFDCVFVSPGTVHQFRAGEAEPLGFLCVVDRKRDRPRLVDG
jgi:quercetin dioxygenase-like cupin family protein